MAGSTPVDARRSLLAAWADLAPSGSDQESLVVAPANEFLWLGTDRGLYPTRTTAPARVPESPVANRLSRLDAVNAEEPVLREGWVFLGGRVARDGELIPFLQPILSRRVRLAGEGLATSLARQLASATGPRRIAPAFQLTADGETEASPLIDDPARRALVARDAEFGRGGFAGGDPGTVELVARMPALLRWIADAAEAMGIELDQRLPTTVRDPSPLLATATGVRAFVGSAVYHAPEAPRPAVAASLAAWSRAADIDRTSFAVLYPDDGAAEVGLPDGDGASEPIESSFVLSRSQARVVAAARTSPLTVVSGAPGTGKSHAVAAVAVDHVARGGSVLVATRSRFAARAIAELIDRVPGPDALRFGDIVDGSSVVDELNDQLVAPPEPGRAEEELDRARGRRDAARAAVRAALALEVEAAEDTGPVAALRVAVPTAFEPTTDLDALAAAATAARATPSGWLDRRRQRRHRAALAELVGAGPSPDEVVAAVEAARRRRAASILAAEGGTAIGEGWMRLLDAEADLRDAFGRAAQHRQERSRRARGAVSELLAALRAGRGRRRELLQAIDAEALTAAVPLWIGTLGDVEDLLPARAGAFDLVILDEAAHVDQPSAAPALLRGRRAMVVGDPRQLRHVSFLADEAIEAAMATHGVPRHAAGVDLRRSSVFDRAAAVAPVLELAEHFRSAPHLVAFPIREFYRDRIDVMTRRPDTDRQDRIDVVVPGSDDRTGEVEAVLALLADLVADDDGPVARPTVGIVSPFREHADAIGDAVLERLDEGQIRALGLRVGTVHGFQGAERDLVVVALGIGPDDAGGRVGFVENRNLFNVMVSRARERMVVVTAREPSGDGLVGRYLRHAHVAPVPEPDLGATDAWTNALAAELARAQVPTRAGYRMGPWVLDLVVDDPTGAIAIETRVLDDDPDAHIERHLALARAGWSFVEAYPSRWDDNVARAALEVPDLVATARASASPLATGPGASR